MDDHRSFSDAFRIALSLESDLECVGIANSVGEAMAAIEEHDPDVVVLDVHLPDGSGMEAISILRRDDPPRLVVVLTADPNPALVLQAASHGASAFMTKETPLAEVVDGIRSAGIHGLLVDARSISAALEEGPKGKDRLLTDREQQVLELLGQGLHPAAIAKALSLSQHTVRGHVKVILAKLGVHSQLAAVVEATRRGLLTPTQPPPPART